MLRNKKNCHFAKNNEVQPSIPAACDNSGSPGSLLSDIPLILKAHGVKVKSQLSKVQECCLEKQL